MGAMSIPTIPSKSTPVAWFLGGVVFLLLAVILGGYAEVKPGEPHNYTLEMVVETLKSIGAAIIVIGGVNIIIETGHWRHYFEERLKDIVVQQNYLNALDKTTLANLHVKLLQAQFRDSSISGDDSFFSFYNKNIHQYIGGPFREDATGNVVISETPRDEPWKVRETIRFTCRKNGGKIQDVVSWQPDESQLLDSIKISIQLPTGGNEIEIFQCSAKDNAKGLDLAELKKLKAGINLTETIINGKQQDLTGCDRLGVAVEAQYQLRKTSALTWSFALPTKRFHLTVLADAKYDMVHELFAANEDSAKIIRSSGSISLNYSDWMLPQNGVVIRLLPRQLT